MVDRRDFLKVTGAGFCGLLGGLPDELLARIQDVNDPLSSYPYRAWEDFYRKEFAATRGDSQGYAFHCSNCQGNCAFRVFAKDGVVTREEQLAQYPQINLDIPDPNPRGCNKGTIHSQAMYEKDRLLYPLKRAGARGEGKWQRVSWDQAIGEIAEKVVDTLAKHGPGALMLYTGTGILSQGRRAGPLRLGSLLGAQRLYPSSAVGDMFTGATLAYGIPNVGTSLDAWFEMDYIVLWGFNPNVTRIPDAHYLWEAKWRGAKIVVISPDYNPTAIHADWWIPINPGSDSFLAMSLVHVVLKEKLYKEDFIREQTDLPFLVRADNGKLLRMSDLRKGSKDDVFYCWDEATKAAMPMPGTPGPFPQDAAARRAQARAHRPLRGQGRGRQADRRHHGVREGARRGGEVLARADAETHRHSSRSGLQTGARIRQGARSRAHHRLLAAQVRLGHPRLLGAGAVLRAHRPRRGGHRAPVEPGRHRAAVQPEAGALRVRLPRRVALGAHVGDLPQPLRQARNSRSRTGLTPDELVKLAETGARQEVARELRRAEGAHPVRRQHVPAQQVLFALPEVGARRHRAVRQRQFPHGLLGRARRLRAAGEQPLRGLGHPRRGRLPPLREPDRAAAGPEADRRDEIRVGDLPAAGREDRAGGEAPRARADRRSGLHAWTRTARRRR